MDATREEFVVVAGILLAFASTLSRGLLSPMTVHVRMMTEADIPFGMGLKDHAGWNQTPADWRRFLGMQPDGCFVAEVDRQPVATTTTCGFDSVGWIAMVLVDQAFRHRGIGTQMVEHAVAYLETSGVRSVRLDATPLGKPVYERLGFVAEYELVRYQASLDAPSASRDSNRIVQPDGISQLATLDLHVTGTHRGKLLERLRNEQPHWSAVYSGKAMPRGYLFCRPGARAVQIGPAIAMDEDAGHALLDWACCKCALQTVFIDVPVPNDAAQRFVVKRGFREQRRLTRMVRGDSIADDPTQIWASSGPEKG